jgi:adenylate cyclase
MSSLKTSLVLYFKKKATRISLGLLLTIIFTLSSAGYFEIPGINVVEHQLYDLKVRMSAKRKTAKESNVVILDIDEKSLADFGRWPWSRTLIAKINDKLFDQYKVSALGYDVVWAERDSVNPKAILEQLNLSLVGSSPHYLEFVQSIQRLDSDRIFAASIKSRAVVLGFYFNNEKDAQLANVLPAAVLSEKELPPDTNSIMPWQAYTGNLPELNETAMSGGYFNPVVDEDGVIRRIPLLAKYKNHYYQSLSLGLVRAALGGMPITPVVEGGRETNYFKLEKLSLGPINIPVAPDGTAFIPYHGGDHSFPYISVSDLLNDKVPQDKLEGKIVVMGSSAPGLRDQRSTPIQSVFPGVEIHANVIDGILDNEVKQTPAYAEALVIIQVFMAGLILAVVLPALGAFASMIMSLVMILIGFVFNYALWTKLNFVMPIAQPLIIILLIFIVDMALGYLTEGRLKKNMSNLFGQYVPPELVKKMAEDPLKYSMVGKDAELTVLFSDIRGFTGIAEKLTASQLTAYINEYFDLMSTFIHEENGTLDKYIGDAIMAFWGAPIESDRHAHQAILAALKMSEAVDRLAQSFEQRGMPPFNIGIGLNTGLMTVGDMGSSYRRSYTVMGDSVNLASRLEGLTKYYGLRILVGEATMRQATDFAYQEIDRVKVKGKELVVTIYTPIGLMKDLDSAKSEEMACWSEILPLYYASKWDEFILGLTNMIKTFGNSKIYTLYLDRAETFKKVPPLHDWHGVCVFVEK